MKIAAYLSDVNKLSIMSTEYERQKEDSYPLALFDNEKNNIIYGRNQFLIGELLRFADKIFREPITREKETLFFFRVALLNQENIYQKAIINHTTALIPKVSALNSKKLNPRIAAELDNRVQLILKLSLSKSNASSKDFELFLAEVLGVSLISINCIKEFFSLRFNSRNYILKALRYIIFDSTTNDAVYPELNILKKKYGFSLRGFSEFVANELLFFYKIGINGCNYPNITRAISNICKNHTNSFTFDTPLLLNKLDLNNAFLSKVEHICESDSLLGQMLIHALNRIKKTDINTYLNQLFGLIDGGASEYKIINLVMQLDNKDQSNLLSEPKSQLLVGTIPNYLEIVKIAYLMHLNNGLSRTITFLHFLDSYLMSAYYVHSEKALLILKSLFANDIGLILIRKMNSLENIFAEKETELFSDDKYKFLCKLLFLTITCDWNPIDNFSFVIEHGFLSKKIPDQELTYEMAIKNYETLDSYVELFKLHNPLLAKIENLNIYNPHQFELHKVFDFTAANVPVKILKSPDDFKESLKNVSFLEFCDIAFLRLIEQSNLVVICFGINFDSYAIINISKISFIDNYGYGLMKVIGQETSVELYMDALKIIEYMNL